MNPKWIPFPKKHELSSKLGPHWWGTDMGGRRGGAEAEILPHICSPISFNSTLGLITTST